MTFTNILVLLAAVACTYFAQAKSIRKSTRRGFSFLGGLAALVVAVEAFLRNDMSSMVMFGCVAALNLLIAAFNHPQPANDEH